MKPEQKSNKVVKSVAVVLPILLISAGWMIWRHKHGGPGHPGGETVETEPGSVTRVIETSPDQQSGDKNGAMLPSGTSGQQKKGSSLGTSGSSSSNPSIDGQSGSLATTDGSAPKDGCYNVTFKHKSLSTHSSDDECSHHRNLIKLSKMDVAPSSVCIRVNGTPVRHEAVPGKTDELVIGAVAGPKDVVTARFCVGKAKCSEGCAYPKKEVVKKDEFLEAISGGADDEASLATAQWEAGDAEKSQEVNKALDGEIKRELEEQEVPSRRTAANNTRLEIFKDWIGENEMPACGSQHASR